MRRDDWLMHQLPVAMTEDDFLVRFLTIFQTIGDTVLHHVDNLDYQFDPTVAPGGMVRAMSEWIGVDWIDSSLDDTRQRQLLLGYSDLLRWRGTSYGVRRLLELITEGDVRINDSGGVYPEGESPGGPPHVRIDVDSSGFAGDTDLVRIVRDELPADATFNLFIAGRQIWPAAETATDQSEQMEMGDA